MLGQVALAGGRLNSFSQKEPGFVVIKHIIINSNSFFMEKCLKNYFGHYQFCSRGTKNTLKGLLLFGKFFLGGGFYWNIDHIQEQGNITVYKAFNSKENPTKYYLNRWHRAEYPSLSSKENPYLTITHQL